MVQVTGQTEVMLAVGTLHFLHLDVLRWHLLLPHIEEQAILTLRVRAFHGDLARLFRLLGCQSQLGEVLLLEAQKAIEVLWVGEVGLNKGLSNARSTGRTVDFSHPLIYVREEVLIHAVPTELMPAVKCCEIPAQVFYIADLAWDFLCFLSLLLRLPPLPLFPLPVFLVLYLARLKAAIQKRCLVREESL